MYNCIYIYIYAYTYNIGYYKHISPPCHSCHVSCWSPESAVKSPESKINGSQLASPSEHDISNDLAQFINELPQSSQRYFFRTDKNLKKVFSSCSKRHLVKI